MRRRINRKRKRGCVLSSSRGSIFLFVFHLPTTTLWSFITLWPRSNRLRTDWLHGKSFIKVHLVRWTLHLWVMKTTYSFIVEMCQYLRLKQAVVWFITKIPSCALFKTLFRYEISDLRSILMTVCTIDLRVWFLFAVPVVLPLKCFGGYIVTIGQWQCWELKRQIDQSWFITTNQLSSVQDWPFHQALHIIL